MSRPDTIMKEYMSKPKYFADAFNYYIFQGKQMIHAEQLKVMDPTEIGIVFDNDSEEVMQKIRDVLKQCIIMEDGKVSYLILGIENQTDIHYAMPVKNMIYDALNYGKQVSQIAQMHRKRKDISNGAEFLSGFTKEDKIKPVITLTIYFGADKWDAPRCLKDMFEDISEDILQYVDNYHLNLIILLRPSQPDFQLI